MKWSDILVVAALAMAGTTPGVAVAGPIDDLRAQCYVGTEPPSASGSMPARINGVVTISPREAKCAIDRVPQVLVIAPMRDLEQLPGAIPVPLLSYPTLDADNLAKAKAAVETLTAGDRSRPIIVYCHHASCGYSVEAAKHLVQWGYTNVLWLREGLSGWRAAKYPLTPINMVKTAVGEPSYTIWMKPAGDTTFACFGARELAACDMKVFALEKIYNAPDLPEKDRDIVAGQLFNAAAVRAEIIREDTANGGPDKAYVEASIAYSQLSSYAVASGRPGALAEHAKVVREFVINAIETDRPSEAAALLAKVRTDAAAGFARLAAVRSDEAARKQVHGLMVAMEHLERDIAEFAVAKAEDLDLASKAAAPYRRLALDAIDRAVLWTERNGAEGIGHQMDLAPEYRLSKLLVSKGDILQTTGDEQGAIKAFGLATLVCELEDEIKALNNYERACTLATTRYFLLTPEFKRWSAEQARKEYEFYLSLLKD